MVYSDDTKKMLNSYGWKDPRFDARERQYKDFENRRSVQAPVRVRIDSMYKTEVDDGREYLFYHQHKISEDRFGSEIEVYQPDVGRYEKPHPRFGMDAQGNKIIKEISKITWEYTIPFSKKAVDELLKNNKKDEPVLFYVLDGGFKFKVKYDEFVGKTSEQVGAEGREEIARREREAKGNNEQPTRS